MKNISKTIKSFVITDEDRLKSLKNHFDKEKKAFAKLRKKRKSKRNPNH